MSRLGSIPVSAATRRLVANMSKVDDFPGYQHIILSPEAPQMARLTVVFGILLILLGVGFYIGLALTEGAAPSLTALIPAAAGIPIFLLGLLALREKYRMHAMHGVAVLALLGFLMPGGRLGMQVIRGGELNSVAAASQLLMALLCGLLLMFCVKSFIDARRRQASAAADAERAE